MYICFSLAGYGIAGAGNADPVIGEGGVHAGEFDFRHVTGHALLCADGTGVGVAASSLRVGGFGYVAREAFWIVVGRVLLELLVRIVTGDTSQTRVICVVPATIEHAIRLKANVV